MKEFPTGETHPFLVEYREQKSVGATRYFKRRHAAIKFAARTGGELWVWLPSLKSYTRAGG